MTAAVDLVARAILLLRSRLILRRPTSDDIWTLPTRLFLPAALRAIGRNLSIAIAFLPKPLRQEATVAYLCCRVLDAFEDLDLTGEGIPAAKDYLCGRRNNPPLVVLSAQSESDRSEALLVGRMPSLREAMDQLPSHASARIKSLVDALSQGMSDKEARRARREDDDVSSYADLVLTEVIRYSVNLVAPEVELPRRDIRAAARVLQAANDIRDAAVDNKNSSLPKIRLAMMLQAIIEMPLAWRLLQWIPSSVKGGSRGAIVQLAVTTASFFLRKANIRTNWRLRMPVLASLFAALSPVSYKHTVIALNSCAQRVLPHLASPCKSNIRLQVFATPPGYFLRRFEQHLAVEHPDNESADALYAATTLAGVAEDLGRKLPSEDLTDSVSPRVAGTLLACDYLILGSLRWLGELGPDIVSDFGSVLAESAVTAASLDERGYGLDIFLSRVVNKARNFQDTNLDVAVACHLSLAKALGELSKNRYKKSVGPNLEATLRKVREEARSLDRNLEDYIQSDCHFVEQLVKGAC